MVCKEDVLSWFKDLEGFKRIDVMYELLNMCVPFEIRYLGTCVEEIGKHSYQELRGPAIIANDVEKLSKDPTLTQSLLDENTRHRILIYISLLSVRNSACANWYYKTFFRTDWLEDFIVKGSCKDENVQCEFLLLFTLGLYHPAFTFEQKCFFGKMLQCLLELRECKNRISPKPSVYCHPPGFGFATPKVLNHQDISTVIPVKTALPMVHTDSTLHQPPPGLPTPPLPQAPLEFVATLWNRPGFAGTICGAPEVAPFPQPPISPLVSQATSPTPSRSTSPHRNMNVRLGSILSPPSQPIETLSATTQLPVEQVSQSSLPPVYNIELKIPDDEINHVQDDKIREAPWVSPPINGMRFAHKVPHLYLVEQMQALNVDGDTNLHQSNSSSNSNSNQSPPDTPPMMPPVVPHGPGRGENKNRVNGVPPFMTAPPPAPAAVTVPQTQQQTQEQPPLCETTPPPPPLPTFSNCTVPYSNYPAHVPYTAIPSRFHYTQNYRPPFTAHFTFPTTDNHVYTFPYVPVIYSSSQQLPPRNPNCYNCGASGHVGADCNGQTIEDITQKKAYMLEFASPLPDTDK